MFVHIFHIDFYSNVQGGFSQSATGRGVLSMAALSHGVVRVDSEDSLTSLTLQDCGQVMPGTNMVVVRSEGTSVLCKTDQVGEICVTSGATGNTYFGLDGMTNSTFKVQPLIEESDAKSENNTLVTKPIGDDKNYIRSGLLGFLGPSGLVFICGSRDGLMTVTGRKHNADGKLTFSLFVFCFRCFRSFKPIITYILHVTQCFFCSNFIINIY